MEYTRIELVRESGFSEREIRNWGSAGLLPGPFRYENTGKQNGIIAYYSEETLNRLLVLKNYPVTKITKAPGVGLPGLGFIMFAVFGYNDIGIQENVKIFIKNAIKDMLKEAKKPTPVKESDWDTEEKIFSMPDSFKKIFLNRFTGQMNKKKARIEAEKTPSEVFENVADDILDVAEEKNIELDDFLYDDIEDIFQSVFINMPSGKDATKIINSFKTRDFNLYQKFCWLFIGMQVTLGINEEKLLKWFNKPTNLKIMAVVLLLMFNFTKVTIKSSRSRGIYEKEMDKWPNMVNNLTEKRITINRNSCRVAKKNLKKPGFK
ncbi:hypothetical protein SAMN05660649_05079 [Desulfotomaculum arcticum]|uniref:Uncharacterized protein n=1 Tax=Desulfotruncus arcticus DSM 17038 TaxID=1121424 RepID=A0A1I2ZRQ6_9FIRM|nr:hypothetical protein [Desulfotruncus arcticus]SFH40276.1 hypothetical protein SAMN05660649_05079 [Desulfotomaculum arcticum] [Desulfotruncus arcticus DSM 17038]